MNSSERRLAARAAVARGLLLACGLSTAGLAAAEVVNIDNTTLKRLMAEGIPVVDLRTAPEWKQTGVVERSHMLTLFDERGRANPEQWLAEVNRITGADQPVILICRTGNRTRAAARFMDRVSPQRKIYNVTDGITGWAKAGLPVISQQENRQHAGISCGPIC
jgi:rhodanese-related sulfurtransferase